MDLKDFIAATLTSIIDGVQEAQKHYIHAGAAASINPPLQMETYDGINVVGQPGKVTGANREILKSSGLLALHGSSGFADIVEFDVALTVEDKSSGENASETNAGGGLKVYVVNADAAVKRKESSTNANTQSSVSRIKFRIPVQFPRGHTIQ